MIVKRERRAKGWGTILAPFLTATDTLRCFPRSSSTQPESDEGSAAWRPRFRGRQPLPHRAGNGMDQKPR
jgi:hypothetical protein